MHTEYVCMQVCVLVCVHVYVCVRERFYMLYDWVLSRAKPEDNESEAESSEKESDFDPIAALKNIFFGKCYLSDRQQ